MNTIKYMNKAGQEAMETIQGCIAENRLRLTLHFRARLTQRGLLWPDVLSVIDNPHSIEADGKDDYQRPKWIITGKAATDDVMSVVCIIDKDQDGELTVFITTYWKY